MKTPILLIIVITISATPFHKCVSQERPAQAEYLSSFKKFIDLIIRDQEIPDELIERHLGPDWVNRDEYSSILDYSMFPLSKEGETTYIKVSHVVGGVCGDDIVFSFDKNGHQVSSLLISRACDGDGYREFGTTHHFISDSIIVVTDYETYPIYEDINEYESEPIGSKEFEKYSIYYLQEDGSFEILYKSSDKVQVNNDFPDVNNQLLDNKQVRKFSSWELRKFRNTIFAKKGHAFISSDLKSYFSQFDWYKPVSDDVTDSLDFLEKHNVQLLLREENRRKDWKSDVIKEPGIVLNGYFMRIGELQLFEKLKKFNVISYSCINKEEGHDIADHIGENGLIVVQADLSEDEFSDYFSEFVKYTGKPIVVNNSDTLNFQSKRPDPTITDSVQFIPPFEAAKKYGSQYRSGILKYYSQSYNYHSLFNTSMNDSIYCYRIPAIVTAPNGDLIVAIDERVPSCGDLKWSKDINIVLRRSTDNGKTWTEIERIVDYPIGQSASDPSMIVDEVTSEIFMFYNYMDLDKEKDVYYLHYVKSSDNGKSWSEPVDITDQIAKPEWKNDFKFITSGRGMQTQDGKLVHTMVNLNNGMHLFYSDDHGKSWNYIDVPIMPANESKIIELDNGNWMINSRVNGGGLRYVHTSSDLGRSWTSIPDSSLIDPGCNASIIRYFMEDEERSILLFLNANDQKKRKNLTLKVSHNNGRIWSKGHTIYYGPSAYSTMTIMQNGNIGLVFEKDNYKDNVFVEVDIKSLLVRAGQ